MNLVATAEQSEALDKLKQRELAAQALQASESAQLRRSRKTAEKDRIAAVRNQKALETIDGIDREGVLTEAGRTRSVHRRRTTASKMLAAGTLPKDLHDHLQAFALLCAAGTGAAIFDGADSTSKLSSPYEPFMGKPMFGSRTLSDRQLAGVSAFKAMRARVPAELMHVYCQVVGEEIGELSVKSKTLAEIGEELGFTHRQSNSAGAAFVIAMCSLIAHFIRQGAAF